MSETIFEDELMLERDLEAMPRQNFPPRQQTRAMPNRLWASAPVLSAAQAVAPSYPADHPTALAALAAHRPTLPASLQQCIPPGILGKRRGAAAHPLQSLVLSDPAIERIAKAMPTPHPISGWRQLFSTAAHGFSLATLYDQTDCCGAAVVAVQTTQGDVFGAMLSDGIRRPARNQFFYGTSESFLFSVRSGKSGNGWRGGDEAKRPRGMPDADVHLDAYHWTQDNFLFTFSSPGSISIGGGDGATGIYIEDSLTCGSTAPCETFGNPALCPPQEAGIEFAGELDRMDTELEAFEIAYLEVWGVDPMALGKALEHAATAASMPSEAVSQNHEMSSLMLDNPMF